MLRNAISFLLVLGLCGSAMTPVAAYDAPTRPNFSMQYTVQASEDPRQPAKVSVGLLGGNEILKIIWKHMDATQFTALRASGRLLQNDPTQWTWYPDGVAGEFSYHTNLTRSRSVKGFDSYHGGTWILTRTSDLFPMKRFTTTRSVRALSRVTFQLPANWQVVTAMRPIDANTFEARDRGHPLTSPYGWILMGKLDVHRFREADVDITVASPSVMHYDAAPVIDLLKKVVERLEHIVRSMPAQITVVVGPDPLWRGGLSGEDSLYLNQNLPLIASDYTSTVVHELFHIAQGFRKANTQADWVIEGIAEYYSLRILREIRAISKSRFVKGVRKFDRQGLWHRNFLQSTHYDVLYNASPLVFFYIDELIRDVTHGELSLRSIIKQLGLTDRITTESFHKTLTKSVPGVEWEKIFHRYVIEGRRPPYEKYLHKYES